MTTLLLESTLDPDALRKRGASPRLSAFVEGWAKAFARDFATPVLQADPGDLEGVVAKLFPRYLNQRQALLEGVWREFGGPTGLRDTVVARASAARDHQAELVDRMAGLLGDREQAEALAASIAGWDAYAAAFANLPLELTRDLAGNPAFAHFTFGQFALNCLSAAGFGRVAVPAEDTAQALATFARYQFNRGLAVFRKIPLDKPQVAVALNVSEAFVDRIRADGRLGRREGAEHLSLVDVLEFKVKDDEHRRGILDELTAEAQGLGLEY